MRQGEEKRGKCEKVEWSRQRATDKKIKIDRDREREREKDRERERERQKDTESERERGNRKPERWRDGGQQVQR